MVYRIEAFGVFMHHCSAWKSPCTISVLSDIGGPVIVIGIHGSHCIGLAVSVRVVLTRSAGGVTAWFSAAGDGVS
jgi:hypothetical protein